MQRPTGRLLAIPTWFLTITIVLMSEALGSVERPIIGKVVDGEGYRVPGATIYLTEMMREPPRSSSGRPSTLRPSPETMRVLRSGPDGIFLADLPSGRYHLAASKTGYDTFLGELSAPGRRLVEVRLREESSIVLGDLPVGPAGQELGLRWILRRAQNDVLRDRKPVISEAATDDARGGPPWSAPTGTPPGQVSGASGGALPWGVQGVFAQRFSGAGALVGGADAGGDPSGRSTRLELDGAIGSLGSWRFDGESDRSRDTLGGEGALRQARRSSGAAIGMECRPATGNRLRADLRYAARDYVLGRSDPSSGRVRQMLRTVGVDSSWDRDLGSDAALRVDALYAETGLLESGPSDSPLDPTAGEGDPARIGDVLWGAGAALNLRAGDDHRLDFVLRTRGYRYDLRDDGYLLDSPETIPAFSEPGEHGRSLSLLGRDEWRLGQGMVVSYGLGYHAVPAGIGRILVPRVGMSYAPWEDARTVWSSSIQYRLSGSDPGGVAQGSPGADARDRGPGTVGYMVGFEHRPETRLQVTARLSYRPFEEALDEPADAASTDWRHDLFLGGGDAARHQLELEVGRAIGPVRGSLTGSIGRARGRLGPALEEAPVQRLTLDEVRFYSTRLRATYGPTDTELEIDYHRVLGEAGSSPAGPSGDVDYRRFDLIVSQELSWLNLPTSMRWRLLMAYQGLYYASLPLSGAVPVSGSSARLTGGVDISF
jgi:hypothetical protein